MLQIAEPFAAQLESLGLTCADAFPRFFLGENPLTPGALVKRSLLAGSAPVSVFYKHYEYPGASWKFLGRASKAKCEFQNYAVFKALGVCCAVPMACGEERDALGRLRRAFIVTREIPNAKTLVEVLGEPTSRTTREDRKHLIRQLAAIAARLHEANFFHHDFVGRNILVTRETTTPKLWLIDCPRGKYDRSWLRHRRRVKDLASLDKSGARLCSRSERWLFLKIYLGKSHTDSELKLLARKVLAYRKKRWPEDWED